MAPRTFCRHCFHILRYRKDHTGMGTLGRNMAPRTFCRHCFHILRYPGSLWYTSCHKAQNWKLQWKQNYNNTVHLMLAGMENLDPDTPAAKLAAASMEVAAMA